MNTLTNMNNFPIGNSLDGVNIITEEIGTLSLLVDGTNSMLADLNMNFHAIKNMEPGVDGNDAVNKSQLDLKADTTYVNSQDNLRVLKTGDTMTGSLNMNTTNKIINLANGTNNGDAVNRSQLNTKADTSYVNTELALKANLTYVDSSLNLLRTDLIDDIDALEAYTDASLNLLRNDLTSDINDLQTYVDTQDNLKLNKAGDTMTGALNMNTTNKIINLANGTNSGDAVNKGQMESADNLRVLKTGDSVSGNFSVLQNVSIGSSSFYAPLYVNGEGVINGPLSTNGDLSCYANLYTSGTSTLNGATTINAILNLNGGTPTDINVDAVNKTNTYIKFGEAGSSTDWAYLRQIGGSGINGAGDIQLALDLHDDGTDGQFHIRSVGSVNNPDTIKPLFTSAQSGTIINYPSTSINAQKQLSLRVDNNQHNGLFFHTNLSPGSWNSLVDTNDKAIIFSDGTTDTGKLVIGNWGSYGMKLDCEGGSMTLNSKQTINKNANSFTNLDVTSSQTIDIKSGNPLYERYNLTYNGTGTSFRLPYNTQADTTLQNKIIAFKITGSTQVFLTSLPLAGAFTTIIVDGVSYVSTTLTKSSSFILKGTGTVGTYTTAPYVEYVNEDQLTIASNLYDNVNDEYAGIRFVGSGTEIGFMRTEVNRAKTDSSIYFVVRQSNALTTPLTISNSINSSVPYLINGANIASIGYNQTWQNPSRAKSTWYNNTTGRPIQVMASFSGNNDANESRFVLEVSTSASSSGMYICVAYTANDSNQFFLSGIIPASGQTWYKIEKATGGNTSWNLVTWSELR